MELNDYKKYRWFYTSSGKLVVGGKNALQNDELVKKIKSLGENMFVMHTSTPGSPFTIIIENHENVKKSDLEESAIFTGCFSKEWKMGKKKTNVDIFLSSNIFKSKSMKEGTWGVKEKLDSINVELKLVLTRQKGILRAVPLNSSKPKEVLLKICPGKIDKVSMLSKIQIHLAEDLSQDELLSALPTGGINICK